MVASRGRLCYTHTGDSGQQKELSFDSSRIAGARLLTLDRAILCTNRSPTWAMASLGVPHHPLADGVDALNTVLQVQLLQDVAHVYFTVFSR